MPFGDRVPDKTLLQQVNKKLAQAGMTSHITATVSGGYVTLTGTLQYANQRRLIARKAGQVNGVRQVVDQMTVKERKRVDVEPRYDESRSTPDRDEHG